MNGVYNYQRFFQEFLSKNYILLKVISNHTMSVKQVMDLGGVWHLLLAMNYTKWYATLSCILSFVSAWEYPWITKIPMERIGTLPTIMSEQNHIYISRVYWDFEPSGVLIFLFIYLYVHTLFRPSLPAPSLSPPTSLQAVLILPSPPILLKRRHKK
jgi:hypothetical protein